MTIEAKVIAHSRSPFHNYGVRDIATFFLRYPRFVHAELMTHRAFSRNASSSRAIPVERLIADVIRDTAMPIHWGKHQKGMQAREEQDIPIHLPELVEDERTGEMFWSARFVDHKTAWLEARDAAIRHARAFADAGYHKQIVNRLLEPYAHINVVVTATNFDNFFWLRSHPDAQPEIKLLSDLMLSALRASKPRLLKMGEWHAPYIRDEERVIREEFTAEDGYVDHVVYDRPQEDILKVSTARCARTSFLTFDGKLSTFEADMQLYGKLVGSAPLHASPAEHQAMPDIPVGYHDLPHWERATKRGNFDLGWVQHRKLLPNEYCTNFDEWRDALLAA
jgi:hypothetical protein